MNGKWTNMSLVETEKLISEEIAQHRSGKPSRLLPGIYEKHGYCYRHRFLGCSIADEGEHSRELVRVLSGRGWHRAAPAGGYSLFWLFAGLLKNRKTRVPLPSGKEPSQVAEDLCRIWYRALAAADGEYPCLDLAKCYEYGYVSSLYKRGSAAGVFAMISAYAEGVPVEDLV